MITDCLDLLSKYLLTYIRPTTYSNDSNKKSEHINDIDGIDLDPLISFDQNFSLTSQFK